MPERSTALIWTNTSLPPPSGWMNPNPLVALNHLTVPVAIVSLRWASTHAKLPAVRSQLPPATGSHRCADLPRLEFIVTDAQRFRLRLLPRRRGKNEVEDAPAVLLDGLLAVDDGAAVDVHVVGHAPVERGIRRKLERRCGLAAEHAAAAGREAEHVGAARHLAGGRDWVVAGRIHIDEALGRDRLGILVDVDP